MNPEEARKTQEELRGMSSANPTDPNHEVWKQAYEKVEGVLAAEHVLTNELYNDIGKRNAELDGLASSPTEFSLINADNQKKIRESQKEVLGNSIRKYTGLDNINMDQGADFLVRARSGLAGTPKAKLEYLYKTYDKEDIQHVPMGEGIYPLIRDKETNQWHLFNDVGVSAGDIADLSRDAVTVAAEVGGAMIAAKLSAGGSLVGNVGGTTHKLMSILGGAGGTFSSNVLLDAGIDQEREDIYSNAFKEAGWTIGIDAALMGGAKLGSRFFSSNENYVHPSETMEKFHSALNSVAEDTGAKVPKNRFLSGSERDLKLATMDSALYPKTKTADTIGEIHDMAYAAKKLLNSGEALDFDTVYPDVANKALNHAQKVADDLAKTEGNKAITLNNIIQGELSSLGGNAGKPRIVGESLMSGTRDSYDKVIKRRDELYDEFLIPASEVKIGDPENLSSLRNSLSKIDLPLDPNGNPLNPLMSPKEAKAYKSIHQLLQYSDDKFGNVTLDKLSDVNDALEMLSKSKDSTQIIKKVHSAVRDLFDSELKNSGLGGKKSMADAFMRDTVGEWRAAKNSGMMDLVQRDFSNAKHGGREALYKFFSPSKAGENVQSYLKLVPDQKSVNQLKGAYGSYLNDIASRDGGMVSPSALFKNMDLDVVEQLYGSKAVQHMKELRKAFEVADKWSNTKVSQEFIDETFQNLGSDNLSSRQIRDSVKLYVSRANRENRVLTETVEKFVKDNTPERLQEFYKSTPSRFIDASMQWKPKDVKAALNLMTDAQRESYKQGVVKWLYDNAASSSAGILEETSKKHGKRLMWNPVHLEGQLSKHKDLLVPILGEETFKRIKDSNYLLKKTAVRGLSDAEMSLKGRVLINGGGIATYVTLPIESVARKFMSIIDSSETLTHMLRGIPRDDIFAVNALPALIASEGGLSALLQAGEKDKEFAKWLFDNIEGVKDEYVDESK